MHGSTQPGPHPRQRRRLDTWQCTYPIACNLQDWSCPLFGTVMLRLLACMCPGYTQHSHLPVLRWKCWMCLTNLPTIARESTCQQGTLGTPHWHHRMCPQGRADSTCHCRDQHTLPSTAQTYIASRTKAHSRTSSLNSLGANLRQQNMTDTGSPWKRSRLNSWCHT